jgi:hypothetical protein
MQRDHVLPAFEVCPPMPRPTMPFVNSAGSPRVQLSVIESPMSTARGRSPAAIAAFAAL